MAHDIAAGVMVFSANFVYFGFKRASFLIRTEGKVFFLATAARHSFSWLV